jgi:hypothetical protein
VIVGLEADLLARERADDLREQRLMNSRSVATRRMPDEVLSR